MMQVMLYEVPRTCCARRNGPWLKAWAMKIAGYGGMKKAIMEGSKQLKLGRGVALVGGGSSAGEVRWAGPVPGSLDRARSLSAADLTAAVV
jgi:hypothetical protein